MGDSSITSCCAELKNLKWGGDLDIFITRPEPLAELMYDTEF